MRKILALIFLVVVLLPIFCYAGTTGYTQDMDTDPREFHGQVIFSESQYIINASDIEAGTEYVLLIIENDGTPEGYILGADSILYIEQKVAGPEGISFNIALASLPSCSVVLSGGETPIILGIILENFDIADVNRDARIDYSDLELVANAYGERDSFFDLNSDGVVNLLDLMMVANNMY